MTTAYEQLLADLPKAPRTWLITGAAGFIGSHLLETLLKLDQTVVGLDNFATGYQRNLSEVQTLVTPEQWARFTFIEGDIRSLQDCQRACQDVHHVLHQAALGSVPRSLADPVTTNATTRVHQPMWIDKLVIALLSPLGFALCLGLLALWVATRGYGKAGWCMGLLAVGWLLVWSMPGVSRSLQVWVEADHPPQAVAAIPTAQALVLLGGGITPAPRLMTSGSNLGEAADRMWWAAKLYHAGKAPVVVLSGGSDPVVSATSEAQAMHEVMRDLGVPAHVMMLEERSRNTRQNAKQVWDLLQPNGIRHIVLVTSAMHMRRAVSLFEAQGFEVTAAPTDHDAGPSGSIADWLPNANALDASARAIKELIGRWTGR